MEELKLLFNVIKVKVHSALTGSKDTEFVVKEKIIKKRKFKRSYDGQRLTEGELDYLYNTWKNKKYLPCINCQEYFVVRGPEGGISTNHYCHNCGQGINFTSYGPKKSDIIAENIGINPSWIIEDKSRLESIKIPK